MRKIPENELKDIIKSYGFNDLIFDTWGQVEPDSCVYVFHNSKKEYFVLFAADFLGGYEEIKYPHKFEFDFGYGYTEIKFTAEKPCSYIDNAPKRAADYIDDNRLWTKSTSTGDICMLFKVNDIKSPSLYIP